MTKSNSKAKAFYKPMSHLASDNSSSKMEQSRLRPLPRQYSIGQTSVHVFKVCFVLVPTQVLWVLFTMTMEQAGPGPGPGPVRVPVPMTVGYM